MNPRAWRNSLAFVLPAGIILWSVAGVFAKVAWWVVTL